MLEALRWALPDEATRSDVIGEFGLAPGEYAIATIHRAENTDDAARMRQIMAGLGKVAEEVPVILPLHPRSAAAVEAAGPSKVEFIDPIGHREMLALASGARIGLTDSGGLQKELFWLGVPCVTLRDETEWVETVESGWNSLAGANAARIVHGVTELLEAQLETPPVVYGDGAATRRILDGIAASHDALATPSRPQ